MRIAPLPIRMASMGWPGNRNKQTTVDAHDYEFPRPPRAMVDSFVFHIDWTTVAMVVGLLLALSVVFLYARWGVIRLLGYAFSPLSATLVRCRN